MHIKKYDVSYDYDYDLDVVNIEINEDYVHEKTIELAFGIFLDFDKNCVPANLEIVSASKILGIEKEFLVNPDGNVTIVIAKDVINVEVTFKFKNEDEKLQVTALNDYGFPYSEISFALA